ncbi:MAG: S41 family peptidase [Phycisphaerales bacterium]|nr:S41 family peptidase [Phycisphaerales bacterium]
MRTIDRTIPLLLGALVMVVGGCKAPLPGLDDYGSPPRADWSVSEDRDVQSTLLKLDEHHDALVREQAATVRDSIARLDSDRSERVREIERDLEEDGERLAEVMLVEIDTSNLPGGETPDVIRDRMIDRAMEEERRGAIGKALEYASIATAIEKYTQGISERTRNAEDPREMERRLTRRLELVRIADPELGVRLGGGTEADAIRADRITEEETDALESLANAGALVQLMRKHHVDGPSLASLHRAGLDEVLALCEILDLNGQPDAGALSKSIAESEFDLESGRTMSLLSELDRLQEEHAGESLPRRVMARTFVEGAAGALDHRTRLIWPDEFARYLRQVGRRYRGMGSSVRQRGDGSMVLVPIPGGPSAKAGIRPGDRMIEINGLPVSTMSLEEMTLLATDPERESIEVLVERADDESRELVEIRLGPVLRPHVSGWLQSGLEENGVPTWNWLADESARIAYIRLDGFRLGGDRAIRLALREAQEQAARSGGRLEGLVLDLRENGGGQVDIAEEVANLFIEDGTIFRSTDGEQRLDNDRARSSHAELAGMPLVILVDEQSASASELVSGLLQARNDAIVLGDRTFGKGSIQTPMRAFSDDCLLLVTTGWYLLPPEGGSEEAWRYVDRDRTDDTWGVLPDVFVPMSFDETDAALNHRGRWYSNLGSDVMPDDHGMTDGPPDPALETGIALLRARILGSEDQ